MGGSVLRQRDGCDKVKENFCVLGETLGSPLEASGRDRGLPGGLTRDNCCRDRTPVCEAALWGPRNESE